MTPDILYVFVLIGVAGVLFASGRVRLDIVSLLVVLALYLGGILDVREALAGFGNPVVIMVAGLLIIGEADAMTRTGGIDFLVENLIAGFGASGPYVMMTALFLLTAALGTALSNTATAVLVAPIAIRAAEAMQLSPYAFAMVVAIAASSAFVTPVSSPAMALIVEPGKYRFADFVKAGLPVLSLSLGVSLLVIPLVFRF
jgi:di/tricarboxylate transporter